ncbi:MAG: GEVED domain-containing protein [Prevotellaceae bacterium]|jgi:uncharacterized repeat protein (TIGR01451 family)|nr:GEVED domain-containing protein [Prevotellaceae bacterium]
MYFTNFFNTCLLRIAMAAFIVIGNIYSISAQHDLYGRWVKRAAFGSGGSASISRSIADEDGNIYLSGRFTGTLNFSDELCSPVSLSSQASLNNAFLVKFDANGKYKWIVTVSDESTVNSGNGKTGTSPTVLDYAAGKILFGCSVNSKYPAAGLPRKTKYTSSFGNQSVMFESNNTSASFDSPVGESSSQSYHMQSLQIINAATGALESSIGSVTNNTHIFTTGTPDVYASFVNKNPNKIICVHYGYGTIYGSSGSKRSIATTININGSNISHSSAVYNGQQTPTNSDGSRIRRHLTLADGSNVVIQLAQDYNLYSGKGVPTYYIYKHGATFSGSSMLTGKTLHDRAIGVNYAPHLSCDASNIYIALNFGDGYLWDGSNTGGAITGSTNLNGSGFLFDGRGFATVDYHNKVVLAQLKQSDLSINAWAIQIGTTGGTDKVYCTDVKTKNGFTYVTGYFSGSNVPFGNGKNLSSSGNFDGFYAVYDNSNGNCVYVVKMGGAGNDYNNTLFISDDTDRTLIGGTYNSSSIQLDPSGSLYPITSDGVNSQGFVAIYTPSPASNTEPVSTTYSFGDAPESYGTAVHRTCKCLSLGNLDTVKLQGIATYSLEANSDENDDSFVMNLLAGGFLNHNHTNHLLESADGGRFTIKVQAKNTSIEAAKLRAWIDFNHNGVFDSGEESELVNVSSGTNTFNLVWKGVAAKIRNGLTYLRIRLTTDNISEGQSAGLFDNGEVEDYMLSFNLLEVSKTVSPKVARVGDELSYTINIKNNAPFSLTPSEIIDPISPYTSYLAGSANNSGSFTNVNIDGQLVGAIKWASIASLSSGQQRDYSFKLTIDAAPQFAPAADSLIVNIAYAIFNTDSISSSGLNCNRSEVEVIVLDAVNDTVTTSYERAKTIAVLSNDLFRECFSNTVTLDLSSVLLARHGQVSINADNTIEYTPDNGFFGIDSFRYVLTGCSANFRRDSAMVYIAVLKQGSLNYSACNGASINLSLADISGITYTWYNVPTGGSSIYTGSTLSVVKNSNHLQEFWVEAVGSIRFPLHRIELLLADNCGTTIPANCAIDGSLIWKEDFDSYDNGLNPTSNVRSLVQLPQGKTDYTFGIAGQTAGEYSLIKHGLVSWEQSFATDDHTSPSKNNIGRMMLINGNNTPTKVYQQSIHDVCENSILYFSFWAGGWDAQLRLSVHSSSDNSLLGVCEFSPLSDASSSIIWKHYGFNFQVPSGVGSIYFSIYNNYSSSAGNDFAIDDIEVRLCAPPVTNARVNGKLADTICSGGIVELTVDQYSDNGLFVAPSDNLKGYWLRSFTGDINTPTDWTVLSGSEVTGVSPLVINQFIDSPPSGDTVYYRFVVSSLANIDLANCRASSAVLPVIVRGQSPQYQDIRLQVCTGMTGLINLSSYLDTIDFVSVQWTAESPSSPAFVNNTSNSTGSLNFSDFSLGTHIYRYDITNVCGIGNGKLYLKSTSKPVVPSMLDTIVICYSIPSAAYMQLNQIIGIEANGQWNYNSDLTPYVNAISSPSHFAGAYIFNATAAWSEVQSNSLYASYKIVYNGDINAAAFTFRYITGAQSCFENKSRRLVLVITSKILPLH